MRARVLWFTREIYYKCILVTHNGKDYKVLFEQILPILLPCGRNAICWRNANESTVHRHSETLSESELNAIGSSLIPSTPRVLLVNTHRISNHMSTSSSLSAFNLLEHQARTSSVDCVGSNRPTSS